MPLAKLIQLLRINRVMRGADLLLRLQNERPGMSRASLMRMLKGLGNQVVTGGSARRTSYAARRSIRGDFEPLPVYCINEQGQGSQVAVLNPIYPNGCLLSATPEFAWPLCEDMRDGWHVGLPYMFDDMRPQGFLGRNFARAHALTYQVPEDPTKWNEDDVLVMLAMLGSDTQGNLIIGDVAYRRFLQQVQNGGDPILDADIPHVYRDEAQRALQFGVAHSSAGGEFPKFTACIEKEGLARHVLVKFSGDDQTLGTQRWADLLICEHLALNTIQAELGVKAAKSRIIQVASRTFFEAERFDRHGAYGRSAVVTWAALEAAMFGMAGSSWVEGGKRLLKEKLISEQSQNQISMLWHFGKMIANTDMHEGNLAFQLSQIKGNFEVAPAYDMLPMLYAPLRGVELPQRQFKPELPLPGEVATWLPAAKAAKRFWGLAAQDLRISQDFREICTGNQVLLLHLLQNFE